MLRIGPDRLRDELRLYRTCAAVRREEELRGILARERADPRPRVGNRGVEDHAKAEALHLT